MWAVGCVLGELHMRAPLFPGKNAVHTLELIFATIGQPSNSVLRRLLPGSANLDMRARFNAGSRHNDNDATPFAELIVGTSGEFIALLIGLCMLDPRSRYNSWRAIEDPSV